MVDLALMQLVGVLGYLVTGLLFFALTALMAIAWCRHRAGGLWVIVGVINAIWAGVLAGYSAGVGFPPEAVFAVEVIRAGAWLTFLSILLSRLGDATWARWSAVIAWPIVLLAGLLAGWANEGVQTGVAAYGLLFLSLAGLVLLEQVFRNSPAPVRNSFKPLVLGVGGIFAFDLFLYSQAVLLNGLDAASWLARGAVNIVLVPLIALAAKRSPTLKLDIFVSRQVVFYSTAMVAVGLYLVLMAIGGYLLIRFGGTWGALARVFFFAGSIAVLLTLLFSSRLRARIRVFLSKHFFQNKYDYREEWLRLVSTLSNFEGASTRENAVTALAQIVDSPAGGLWLLDRGNERYQLVATLGEMPRLPDVVSDDSLIVFMKREGWLIDLHEYRHDPSIYGDLSLPGWLTRIDQPWLVVPLMLDSQLFGLVVLTEAAHTPTFNFEDRDLLKTVGSHVAVHLAQEMSDELLSEAQQFEAFHRLTAFLMHDMNNLIAQQSLIVSNAENHKRNPEFVDDALETIAASVSRMKRLMEQLKHPDRAKLQKTQPVKYLVSTAVDRCSDRSPEPSLDLGDVEMNVTVDAERFIAILCHLIRNAQEATSEAGTVRVSLSRAGDCAGVAIDDTGVGMDPDFVRERLFRPFDSTKGSRGMGIGVYQARKFATEAGGELLIESTPGEGTSVRLRVPRAAVVA